MRDKSWVTLAALAASLTGTSCKAAPQAPAVTIQTEEQKTMYALGVLLGNQLTPLKCSADELALVQRGLADVAGGKKAEVDMDVYGPKVRQLAQTRAQAYQAEQSVDRKSTRLNSSHLG